MNLGNLLIIISMIVMTSCAAHDHDSPVKNTHEKNMEATKVSDSDAIQVVSLDMNGPRPSVALSINGQAPQPAIFDTGAMSTVINIDIASDLGLQNEGPLAAPFDKAHMGDGYQTTLQNAVINNLHLPKVSVPVMPLPLPGYIAVISPNVFSGQLVALDFSKAQLQVLAKNETTTPKESSYPYSDPPFALPTIQVTVGSETFAAHLDTGSPVNIIFPLKYSKQFQRVGDMEKVGLARSHFGEQPIYRARVAGMVKVGPIVLQNPEVRFTDAVPNINVGTDLLRQMQIILDPEEKRLWVRLQK